MTAIRRPGWFITLAGGGGLVLLVVICSILAPTRVADAGWLWKGGRHHHACSHPGCPPDQCLAPPGWAGAWYWMRSPDQEHRVVMGLYNRYCIRCHGIDGRGVWDIP